MSNANETNQAYARMDREHRSYNDAFPLSLSDDLQDYPAAQATFTPGGAFLPVSVVLFSALLVMLYFIFLAPAFQLNAAEMPSAVSGESGGEAIDPDGGIAALFSPEVQRWEPQLTAWAGAAGLDPNLLATVMQIESCGNPQALSHSGAMGLFQVMPFHFENGEDGFDPATNALRGANYLRQAFEARQGDLRGTLASYNGGINGASRPENEWTDEMLRYARWGTGIYQDALNGLTDSPTLQEWLAAGGSSLCAQAGQTVTAWSVSP